MKRDRIQELMIAAQEADDIEMAEVWQDILDRMDDLNLEVWAV